MNSLRGDGTRSLLARGITGWRVRLILRGGQECAGAGGCERGWAGLARLKSHFLGVYMSPCAYLAGLLHPLVVKELRLVERGFQWTPAVNGLFVPFLDGSSIQLVG